MEVAEKGHRKNLNEMEHKFFKEKVKWSLKESPNKRLIRPKDN